MARIIVVGAGLGSLPAVYELRRLLAERHQIVVIANTPFFAITCRWGRLPVGR